MCLEYTFGYFNLNATFWAESKALFLFCFNVLVWNGSIQALEQPWYTKCGQNFLY